jgi:PPOX class probable F420-dependent enzyme
VRLSAEAMHRLASDARVARLGTIDPDGRPHLVPLCFALDGSTFYSEVDQKPKATKRLRRLENIRRDPRVTILVDHYEEEWPKAWWVRMRGPGRVVELEDERDRGRRLLIEKYPQYREDPPTGEVFAVEVEEWLGWSYSPIE